ncbi:MAG: hypothetical protein ABI443_06875, partial [Chthoniobacterales bacterium]
MGRCRSHGAGGSHAFRLTHMKWSFQIARIAGIEVKIHATFFLLLAWYGWDEYTRAGSAAAVQGILFILALF